MPCFRLIMWSCLIYDYVETIAGLYWENYSLYCALAKSNFLKITLFNILFIGWCRINSKTMEAWLTFDMFRFPSEIYILYRYWRVDIVWRCQVIMWDFLRHLPRVISFVYFRLLINIWIFIYVIFSYNIVTPTCTYKPVYTIWYELQCTHIPGCTNWYLVIQI